MQKRASGGASVPHAGQRRGNEAPHDMQNFASPGFAAPQLPQAFAIRREYPRSGGAMRDGGHGTRPAAR